MDRIKNLTRLFPSLLLSQKISFLLQIILFNCAIAPLAVAQITLIESERLQFPAATASPSTGQMRLTPRGKLRDVLNTEVVGTVYHNAEFRVSSDTDKTITIDIKDLADVPGVQLDDFRIRYRGKVYRDFPVSGLRNPGTNGRRVRVGIRVRFDSSVGGGEYLPSYDLTITEDP